MKRTIKLRINGSEHELAVPANALLLDVLRNDLHLVGTKRGCDMGTCGCCNIIIDGRAVNSCLVLAFDVEGRDIQTIEGVTASADDDSIHPLQEAWAECGGSQCGFCTTGFIMTVHALLENEPQPNRARIAEALGGNVCRCTGYKKILDAVELAAGRMAATT